MNLFRKTIKLKHEIYCCLESCKKLGRSLELFWWKGHKSKKPTFFGHSIPFNPDLRILNTKLKLCALLSTTHMQKIRKILRVVLERRPKKSKNTFFGQSIPYNPRLRIFQKNHLAQTMGPIVFYTHAKNLKVS